MKLRMMWMMLVLGAFGAQAGEDMTAHVPKDVAVVARLDWKALRGTELLKTYIKEHPDRYEKSTGRLMKEAGIELDSVDTLWVFSDAKGDGMIGLVGAFDLEAVSGAFAKRKTVQIQEQAGTALAFSFTDEQKGEPRLGVFLDETAMLAGKPELVRSFLGGRAGEVETYEPTNAKLQRVASDPGILAATVFSIPQSWQSSQKMPLVQMVMPMVGDLFLTATLQDKFSLTLLMTPKSPDFQEPLQKVLINIVQLGLAQQKQMLKQNPQNASSQMVVGLLDKLAIGTAGDDVSLSVALTAADFDGVQQTQEGEDAAPAPAE